MGREGSGAYVVLYAEENRMTAAEYWKLAEDNKNATPDHTDYDDLSGIFWKSLPAHGAVYGSDVTSSLFDGTKLVWNLDRLQSILNDAGLIHGVTNSYLYFGMWKTCFAIHTEDLDLYSINFLHFGEPKTWIAIPPSCGRLLEKACSEAFPKTAANCASFLRHKTTLLSPDWLRDHNIPFKTLTQKAGQFVVTFPYSYHEGYNNGPNCAEAVNFATKRWINYGITASECSCLPNTTPFTMEVFVKNYCSVEQYQQWLRDELTIAHPEHNEEIKQEEKKEKSFKEKHPEVELTKFFQDLQIAAKIKKQLSELKPKQKRDKL